MVLTTNSGLTQKLSLLKDRLLEVSLEEGATGDGVGRRGDSSGPS